MSFLRPNYNKPGRGVEKDEPQGSAFVRYFKLYFRNFSKMLGYGVIYAIVLLPLACVAAYVVFSVNPEGVTKYIQTILDGMNSLVAETDKFFIPGSWLYVLLSIVSVVPTWVLLPLAAISAICIGPLNCGIVYCMRNHAREEHAWFSDLFTRAWRNKWQRLAFGILDQAICLSLIIYLVSPGTLGMPDWAFTYCRILCVAAFVIYMIMRWYIYQMIVTFNLGFRGLMKNAWMFVILGFGRNVAVAFGSLALMALVLVLPMYDMRVMAFSMLFVLLFFWSMLMFMAVFGTYPVMHRYLVAPALEEQRKAEIKRRKAAGEPLDDLEDAAASEDGEKKTDADEESSENDSILDDDD